MHPNRLALVALLALLATAFDAGAACTAGNPNANATESTPTSAFVDNHDGTVTHNLTGLMWKQCSQGQSGEGCATGAASRMTWSAALATAVADTTAEHNDWRLPNKKELESIVETCGYKPSINQPLFPATAASSFWSGSSYVPNPTSAWGVDFSDGGTFTGYKGSDIYVRLVRGGSVGQTAQANLSALTLSSGSLTPAFAYVRTSGCRPAPAFGRRHPRGGRDTTGPREAHPDVPVVLGRSAGRACPDRADPRGAWRHRR